MIYLNMKTNQGTETVDQFACDYADEQQELRNE